MSVPTFAAGVDLGPLAGLAADPTVTDVLVNGDGSVWVERLGPSGPAEREVLGPSGPAEREVLGRGGSAEREVLGRGGPAEREVLGRGGPAERDVLGARGPAEREVPGPADPAESEVLVPRAQGEAVGESGSAERDGAGRSRRRGREVLDRSGEAEREVLPRRPPGRDVAGPTGRGERDTPGRSRRAAPEERNPVAGRPRREGGAPQAGGSAPRAGAEAVQGTGGVAPGTELAQVTRGTGGAVVDTGLRLTRLEVELLLERIVTPLGLRVDRSSPVVDARLPDGSRVHAVVPPVAVDGPCLALRRFSVRPLPLTAWCGEPVAALLRAAVHAGWNLVVAGGTGAGKTTLLNALAGCAPASERVVTVEDAAELRLPQPHVLRLEARPANAEGVGEVALRDLVRSALRLRPDRLVVGEVRGGEALDLLQALNTGHAGCLATVHANGPADALRRLETLVLLAGVGLPLGAVRAQLASAVDAIVHVARGVDGARRVTAVAEVGAAAADADAVPVRLVADAEHVIAAPRRGARRARSVDGR